MASLYNKFYNKCITLSTSIVSIYRWNVYRKCQRWNKVHGIKISILSLKLTKVKYSKTLTSASWQSESQFLSIS